MTLYLEVLRKFTSISLKINGHIAFAIKIKRSFLLYKLCVENKGRTSRELTTRVKFYAFRKRTQTEKYEKFVVTVAQAQEISAY